MRKHKAKSNDSAIPQGAAVFACSIPAIGSAIKTHGEEGMRITLDVAGTEEGNALPLMTMRNKPLKAAVWVDNE